VRIWGILKQNEWREGAIIADIEVEEIMGEDEKGELGFTEGNKICVSFGVNIRGKVGLNFGKTS
jgi:hypothetical protein